MKHTPLVNSIVDDCPLSSGEIKAKHIRKLYSVLEAPVSGVVSHVINYAKRTGHCIESEFASELDLNSNFDSLDASKSESLGKTFSQSAIDDSLEKSDGSEIASKSVSLRSVAESLVDLADSSPFSEQKVLEKSFSLIEESISSVAQSASSSLESSLANKALSFNGSESFGKSQNATFSYKNLSEIKSASSTCLDKPNLMHLIHSSKSSDALNTHKNEFSDFLHFCLKEYDVDISIYSKLSFLEFERNIKCDEEDCIYSSNTATDACYECKYLIADFMSKDSTKSCDDDSYLTSNIFYTEHAKDLMDIRSLLLTVIQPKKEDFDQPRLAHYLKLVESIPKQHKILKNVRSNVMQNCKKIANVCMREFKRTMSKTTKITPIFKGRKILKELTTYNRKEDKKKLNVKYVQKAVLKKEMEEKEEIRAKRKLNFLINQTELFSHFMAKKSKPNELLNDDQAQIDEKAQNTVKEIVEILPSDICDSQKAPASGEMDVNLENQNITLNEDVNTTVDCKTDDSVSLSHPICDPVNKIQKNPEQTLEIQTSIESKPNLFEDDQKDLMFAKKLAFEAAKKQKEYLKQFHQIKNSPKLNENAVASDTAGILDTTSLNLSGNDLQNTSGELNNVEQPSILNAKLKPYQLQGLGWLVNLYDQGINGILADDMGLGKTVQSISFLAHLYEKENIKGPFLVVTPASTLHNWVSEIERFVPDFKIVLYAGGITERKIMRKNITRNNVIITSYQIIVSDIQKFKRTKFQYMILDEAQAIKSFASIRWKTLLSIDCRNRLLLTGTPIQNTMAELWALLHFIMPTLFDNIEDFSAWFSKDIENKKIDANQLSRLHAILKPFMLRRIKDDVKDELGSKTEINLFCEMSHRQRKLYAKIQSQKGNINENITISNIQAMRFEKNLHTDIFEGPRNIDETFKEPYNSVDSKNTLVDPEDVVLEGNIFCDNMEKYNEDNGAYAEEVDESILEARDFRNTIHRANKGKFSDDEEMLNVMMQYRKVCNHPDIFEKEEVETGLCYLENTRNTNNFLSASSSKHIFFVPKLFTDYVVNETEKIAVANKLLWTSSFIENIDQYQTFKDQNIYRLLKCLCTFDCANSDSPDAQNKKTSMNIYKIKGSYDNISLRCIAKRSKSKYKPLGVAITRKITDSKYLRRKTIDYSVFEIVGEKYVEDPFASRYYQTLYEKTTSNHGFALDSVGSGYTNISNKNIYSDHKSESDTLQFSKYLITKNFDYLHNYTQRFRPLTVFGSDLRYRTLEKMLNNEGNIFFMHDSDIHEKFKSASLQTVVTSLPALIFNDYSFTRNNVARIIKSSTITSSFYTEIPQLDTFISSSGKLVVLDTLLHKLEKEKHRVLIYFQMTKMMDLMEDYLIKRKYSYLRLDGSCRIKLRKELINEWQTNNDRFIFILSTRAGGLGINLTAADTVIFYDSDWNPTVDQQAMDRAHRLGQTKDVTVYRLIMRNTIEERVMEKAMEKGEIQNMVIKGGQFSYK